MTYERKTKYPPRQPRRIDYALLAFVIAMIALLGLLLCEMLGVIPHPESRPNPALIAEANQ